MRTVTRKMKHVVSDRDRHGNVRYYYRKQGQPKIRLSGEYNSDEFLRSYHSAAMMSAPEIRDRITKPHTQNDAGYIYFLRSGDVVKIGFSRNPLGRAESLKTGAAAGIDALLIIRGTRREEGGLHRRFISHRLTGEWFKAEQELLNAMAAVAMSKSAETLLERRQSHPMPTR